MSDKLLLREFYSLCESGLCEDLLNEQERNLKKQGYMILSGKIQEADIKNGNSRVYRKHILEREDKNYQKAIREGRAVGRLDHDDKTVAELSTASHMLLRTFWRGNELWGVLKVLKSTPPGQQLEGLIRDGVRIGISSRALGSVREESGMSIVEDDLVIVAYDCVVEPSTPNAFMYLREAKEYDLGGVITKADRINRLLNEIVR